MPDLVKAGKIKPSNGGGWWANLASKTVKGASTGTQKQAVVKPTVTTAKRDRLTATPTKRQSLLFQPQEDEEERWYKGDQPTSSEVLARIYTQYKDKPEEGQQALNEFVRFQDDPSSPLYNPYARSTNQAVTALSEMGYDLSGGVTKDWLQQNSSLMGNYRTGATGTPLAPSSKSTPEQDAAYWYYKLLDAEDTTERAETEWDALREEIAYWTSRADRNYSDDEILGRIDWNDYPTLVKMDEARQKGVPLALNRSVGYSQDALSGVLWAARNGQSTGNPLTDSVQYALGAGTMYKRDDTITARLDPTSEQYNPYSVGSTLDDAALYFGVPNFDAEWLDANRAILASGDKTAIKYYRKVYDAEQTTQKAETELTGLQQQIEEWYRYTSDPDVILDGLLDDYPTLAKLDESLRSGDLLPTTRSIAYRWQDIEAAVRAHCADVEASPQGDAYAQGVTASLGISATPSESQAAINAARDANINAAGADIMASGTPEEKIAFQTAYSADFPTFVDEMSTAIENGTVNAAAGYAYSLERADAYAASHYLGAKSVIAPFDDAVRQRDAALAEIEEIKGAGVTDPADFAQVKRTDPNGTIHFTTDVEGLFASEAADRERQERLIELQAVVGESNAYIEANQAAYDKAMQTVNDIREGYDVAERLRVLSGTEGQTDNGSLAVMDYLYFFGNEYQPTEWSAQSGYQAALDQGYTREQVSEAAVQGLTENQAEIERVDWVLQQIEDRGIDVPDEYITNLERYRAKLERDVQDAAYFQLPDNEDFATVVADTREKVTKAWSGFNPLPTIIDRGGYSELDYEMTSGYAGFHGEESNGFALSMTDEERDTYLYLLGTQGKEAAQEYYNHMTDETYGVLQTRTSLAAQEFWQNFAGQDALSGTAATILSVIASPMRLAGTLYSAKASIMGDEINPYNSAFGANVMVGTSREAVKQSITDALGEDSFAAQLANFGYDAVTGAADSAVNSLLMGGLGLGIPISPSSAFGKAAVKVADSMIGASGMAAQGAGDTMRDVAMRGGNGTQAWLMAGVTFLAETLSEGITYGNISDALGGKGAEKGFVKTLLSDMLEEFVGEGGGQLLETVGDDQIMGALSNREQAVERYMAEGLSPEEARAKANTDAWLEILYAAGLGAASAGMTTTGSHVISQVRNAVDAARNPAPAQPDTPAPQEPVTPPFDTEPVSPATETDTPVEGENQPVEAPQTEGEETPANVETTQQEESVGAVTGITEPNPTVDVIARGVSALTSALTTADEASQTATVASVLKAGQNDPDSAAAAGAAAQHLSATYGSEKAVRVVRDTLLTAAENGIEQEPLNVALTVAALTEGSPASEQLAAIATNGATPESVAALVESAGQTFQDAGTQDMVRAVVVENQIASRVKELVADGALDGIKSYQTAYSQARSNLRTASADLKQARAQQTVIGQNLQSLTAQYMSDTANMSLFGAVQQATKDAAGAAIVVQQREQAVVKYQAQMQEASKQLTSARESALKSVREQARADILAQQEAAAQEAATAQAAQAEEARANVVTGDSGVTYTGDNQPIQFHYALVDQAGLIASNDTNMQPNPDFPAELQPRDRTRGASAMQVQEMARTLNPNRLGASDEVQNGAPIVGNDLVVESGNGRVLAIRTAMEQALPSAQSYTAWLQENAAKFGLGAAQVTPESVLVRVRDTDVDRAAFVKTANEATTAGYSATESAASDAEKLTSDTLRKYVPNDEGKIDTRDNSSFIVDFLTNVVPKTEQANYRQADNSISQNGLARIRNALFQRAYGSTRLTAALSESVDESVKNVVKALTNVAPRVAVIAEQIKAGQLYDLNIAADLAQAAESYRNIKNAGGDVETYLAQFKMPGFETESETAQEFMRMFEKNRRSAKAITAAINDLLDRVEGYGDPKQISLFGDQEVPSLPELTRTSLTQSEAERKAAKNGGVVGGEQIGLDGVIQQNKRKTWEFAENPNASAEDRTLDAEYQAAINAGDMEKAQRMVNERAAQTGATVFEGPERDNVVFGIRAKPAPKETKLVYKLFDVVDGMPRSLYIDEATPKKNGKGLSVKGKGTPIPVGVWLDGREGAYYLDEKGRKRVVSKLGALAYRPGWHASSLPITGHIGDDVSGAPYGKVKRPNQVYFLCEIGTDTNYQADVDARKSAEYERAKAITDPALRRSEMAYVGEMGLDHVPTDGYYEHKTNTNASDDVNWYISGTVKLIRPMTEAEVNQILAEKGIEPQLWETREGEKITPAKAKTVANATGPLDLKANGITSTEPVVNTGKLLDTITLDDSGKVIPLSMRFDASNPDVRYSRTMPGGVSAMQGGVPAPAGQQNAPVRSGQEIMQKLAERIGIPADDRRRTYLRQLRNNTRGYTRAGTGVIHVGDAQAIDVAGHEFGHNFDSAFDLQAHADIPAMIGRYCQNPMQAAWLSQYPDSARGGEMMAEYVKTWLQDRASAVQFGGQAFTDYFEQSLKSRDWLAPMQEAARDMRAYLAATASARAMASVDLVERRAPDPYDKGLKGLARTVFDKTIPLTQLTDARRTAQGKDFDASKDVRTLSLAKESTISNMTNECLYGQSMVDPQGNVVKDAAGNPVGSLGDILGQVDRRKEKEFNTLWALLHAKDRQAVGKAVFSQSIDLDAAIQQIESANPELHGIINQAEEWYTTFMQTWLVDTGMIEQDTFDALRNTYPNYIPTFRSGANLEEFVQTAIRMGNSPRSGLKTAKGGTGDLYNPVMGMVEYVQRYIANYKNVEVLRAFDDTMRNVSGLEGIAEPVQSDVERVDYRSANEQARDTVRQAIAKMQKSGDITPDGETALLDAMNTLPEQGWIVTDRATGNDVLNIPMPDGTVSRWTVYNPAILRAILSQPTARRAKWLKAAARCTGFLCSMATGRNLGFAGQNWASDVETAMNTGNAAGNWLTYIPQQLGTMAYHLKNIINDRRGGNVDEAYRLFQTFGKMGSRFAFRDTKTQAEARRSLYGGKATAPEVLRSIISSPIVALESVSGFLEDNTRLNEFRKGRYDLDTYAGRLEAGKGAREVTVDFTKSGDAEDLKYAKGIVPFLGAQLQGIYKTARLFSGENAGRRGKIAGRILVNGVMFSLLMKAIRNLTWDDDEKDAYDQMTPYERNKYWHIKQEDGTFIRIKRSQDAIMQFADAAGEWLGNVLTGYEADWGDLKEIAGQIAQNSVIGFDTVFDPFFDAANNRTWYGGTIEDYRMESLSTTGRYDEETSTAYRLASYALNALGIKYSPLDVEYIVNQFTSSMGKTGSSIIGLANDGELNVWNMLKAIGGSIGESYLIDPVYSNNISGEFYAGKTALEEMLDEAKMGRAPEGFRANLTQAESDAALAEGTALTKKGGVVYDAYQTVKDLWKQHDAILANETMTDEDRTAAAREIRKQISLVMLEGNAAIANFMQKYGYTGDVQRNMENMLSALGGGKAVPVAKTAYDTLDQIFLSDSDERYMQQATAVWRATGKDGALPHPNTSFEKDGVKYEIASEDWDNWQAKYKQAYVSYLAQNSAGWDGMSAEDQLELMGKAHTAGNNAAKKWYMKLHGIK